ncbi:hypothetical protein NC651_012041 [Populus alba x Populus x berolinensis]|nr:hypothetical protein NC651_012041 [Populus alba x Populus x berolinensis]
MPQSLPPTPSTTTRNTYSQTTKTKEKYPPLGVSSPCTLQQAYLI